MTGCLERAGVDVIVGDSNGATATGSGGDDLIDLGSDGGRFAIGDNNSGTGDVIGAGNDTLRGGNADDTLFGDGSPGLGATATGAGDDTLVGFGGSDTLLGDNSADGVTTLGPDGGRDALLGGAGEDVLKAGPNDDSLDGGSNSDRCDGEAGTDTAANCEVLAGVP
jgi:Ca2+-binding RTX toxin-like protein